MDVDELVSLTVEGQEVGKVRLAPSDITERRKTNLGLGVVQLPQLLAEFRPARPMPPQERFLLLVRAFCLLMNEGRRNVLDENELVTLYWQNHGVGAFLHHQVRRASGDMLCETCRKPYHAHRLDRSVLDQDQRPFVNRLCNGDLVKL
jgi:hypothetical protein